MAKSKIKKTAYHFGPQTIIRLLIFTGLIYFLIVFLSSSTSSPIPTVLGDSVKLPQNLYLALPQSSQAQIEKLPSHPAIINLQKKINQLKDDISHQTNGFPQKQITNFKKQIIKNIYQDLIDSIDQKSD